MKHKPTYQQGLSREQIDAYRSASQSGKRQTEGALSGDFEQDAMDGWEASGLSTSSMKRLDKRFRFRSSSGMAITAVITAIIVIATTVALLNVPEETPAAPEKVALSVEQTDAVITEAIDTLEELPVTEQIGVVTIRSSQQHIKEQPQTTPVIAVEELPDAVLKPLKPDPNIVANKKTNQSTAKEVYLHDLKLIDYREYRTKPEIAIEKIVLTGTAANYEASDDMHAEPSVETVAIPYHDYIDKTMNFVSRGKWKQALQRLQLVLETYPDDINGHFYAGLCCYNLQQFEEAKQHFATCLQLSYSNFNEEATWYLAQSLVANGEKSSAKELLTAIRDQKGYYAKQAALLLKGL